MFFFFHQTSPLLSLSLSLSRRMKVGTLCHQKSKLLFLFFLSFSLFFGGMVAGDDDGEEDINGDCQSGSEATFSLYEDVFKDGEPIQTIIRHENSSCTSVVKPIFFFLFFFLFFFWRLN